ncbi:U2 small nuclear ribonucleoprotein B'' [Linum perenne]
MKSKRGFFSSTCLALPSIHLAALQKQLNGSSVSFFFAAAEDSHDANRRYSAQSNYLHKKPQREGQERRILDVVALKTAKLRGQAWVCFSEVTAASNAVRQMQGFPFYEKPMRIQYAKTKSDCLVEAEGVYDPNAKKKKKQEEKAEKKRRAEEAQQSATANGAAADSNRAPAPFRQGNSGGEETMPPNNILFIQNLPHGTTSMMLHVLFQQYPGFKEVRMVEAKPGIAFVEFEDDVQSSMAMQALQGFKITPQNPMAISFAKK